MSALFPGLGSPSKPPTPTPLHKRSLASLRADIARHDRVPANDYTRAVQAEIDRRLGAVAAGDMIRWRDKSVVRRQRVTNRDGDVLVVVFGGSEQRVPVAKIMDAWRE